MRHLVARAQLFGEGCFVDQQTNLAKRASSQELDPKAHSFMFIINILLKESAGQCLSIILSIYIPTF
jgi:hypothetical protein